MTIFTKSHSEIILGRFLNLLLLVTCCAFLIGDSIAQELPIAGRVVFVSGSASALDENGVERSLQRRAQIAVGETIKVASDGFLQLRFIDNAIISITCNSSISIIAYQYEDRNSDRAELLLIEGSVRTITGSIQRANYRFRTELAEVSIDGTEFEVAKESNHSYLFGVYDGGILVENAAGWVRLGGGNDHSFARVEEGSAPTSYSVQPTGLGGLPNLQSSSSIECSRNP